MDYLIVKMNWLNNERVDRGGGGGWGGVGAGVIPKFVVFYRFYSIFMYLNAITGYQEYLIDVLK